jgi:hypothetical protein
MTRANRQVANSAGWVFHMCSCNFYTTKSLDWRLQSSYKDKEETGSCRCAEAS